MDGAPLGSQIAGRLITAETRSINTEYYDKIVARDSEELVRLARAQLQAQVEGAVMHLRAEAEIARNQEAANRLLAGIGGNIGALLGEATRMNEQLISIGYSLDSGFEKVADAVKLGFAGVMSILRAQADIMWEQKQILTQIADTIRSPKETEAKECFRKGEKWLNEGAKAAQSNKKIYWDHAWRVFCDGVKINMGGDNYVAWFNIGFLSWKHVENLKYAEYAFDQAQSFSATERNLWHTESLRHLAEMRYLQERHEDAYLTIMQALNVRREYLSVYNAARYASKTQRSEEAIDLLEECIEMEPTTIITMFSEPDFQE